MNKKSKLLIGTSIILISLLVGLGLYAKNVVMLIGIVVFLLIDCFIIVQKKFKIRTGVSIFLTIAELVALSLLFTIF